MQSFEAAIPGRQIRSGGRTECGGSYVKGVPAWPVRPFSPCGFGDCVRAKRLDSVARREPFDLNLVVQAAIRLMDTSVRKATSRFCVQYAEELPMVSGNALRIEQVIVNLLINACQALPSPEHGIFMATSFEAETDLVRLTIRDEGVGIPAEFMNRLTDPFFTTKRETGGTGLGLSISAGIVKEHGGSLSFDSPHGCGTTATLTLSTIKEARA